LISKNPQSRSTGKERDSESGNDYFGARYYSSSIGRFMSPDWSAKVEPVPYSKLDDPQTLNLYAYLRNNPLAGVGADGHQTDANKKGCQSDNKTVCQALAQQQLSNKSEAAIENSTLTGEQAGAFESAVKSAGSANGINPNALVGIAMNESSLNPSAQNPKSSASGLFGLLDSTKSAYGLSDLARVKRIP
jgi:RHS repeat-associated protein